MTSSYNHLIFLAFSPFFLSSSLLHAEVARDRKDFASGLATEPKLTLSNTTDLISSGRICGKSRILISPDGQSFAIWSGKSRFAYDARGAYRKFPDRVQVLSLATGTTNTLDSSITLDPVSWTQDSGRFQVSLSGHAVLEVSPTSERLSGFKLESDAFHSMRVSASKVLSAEALRDQFLLLESFARYDKKPEDRLFAFFGDHPNGVKFSSGNRSLELFDGISRLKNPASLFALRDPKLLSGDSGIVFVGLGENDHILDETEPYLSTFFDRSSGSRSGLFSPKRVFALNGKILELSSHIRDNEIILDVDRVGSQFAVLLQSMAQEERILYGPLDDLKALTTCPPKNADLISSYVDHRRFNNVSIGHKTAFIEGSPHKISFTRFASSNSKTPEATVIFHGGPLKSALSPRIQFDGSHADYSCSDIIVIDGTSAVGGGLVNSSNAARLGFEAFRRDARVTNQLTDALGYERVNIVGNSFGGITAAAASTFEWPELASISLVAPAIHLLSPDQTSRVRGKLLKVSVNRRGLSGFQQYVYGDKREAINRSMHRLLSSPDPRIHLYLGSRDTQAPLQYLPKSYPSNQLTLLDGADHLSVFRARRVRDSLRAKICDG